MHSILPAHLLLILIVAASILLMLLRPRAIGEVWWIGAGAVLLVATRLIPLRLAGQAIAAGTDVYLFLAGMMLLAEMAQYFGVFGWMAYVAEQHANGSAVRLFTLIYLVGTLVTVFLSNDATAVVLTPAVYAAARAAGAEPLPYLFICAFIANAASFVLPISNPANLVVFGERMPHLAQWLRQFGLPSLAAIVVTYVALRFTQHGALAQERIESTVPKPKLGRAGKLAAFGIFAIGLVLITACSSACPLSSVAQSRRWPCWL